MNINSLGLNLDAAAEAPATRTDFIAKAEPRPHPIRRRAILKAHPDVAALAGYDPLTAVITLGLTAGQTLIAAWLGWLGLSYWPLAIAVAFCVGAFANHALFVIIHDASHNCVFKSPTWNKWTAILADLPNGFPTAMGFRCYHMKHHSHLGDYDYDADLPSHWEARVFGRTWYGKAAWMFFFAVFQVTRLGRLRGTVPMWGRWTFINTVCVIFYDLAVVFLFGPNALLYLFASFWFSVGGLHPLGARWVQEHFTSDPEQETFDYYGPMNIVALNIGYHNEHHDFPDVPWTRLPRLKQMAPEFYDDLKTHESWVGLLFKFIFDPGYTLYTRVDRSSAALRRIGERTDARSSQASKPSKTI
ncbi:fatty acid desaturase [Methylocapsa palsarum]|uniref:Sphingolipid delta-4 desaturase n=1 Tax=Methylocapsa palsarum TaxID=1612308 RepID=A0A1I3XXS7_9HYPH|nr:fatty acid desaturase [Methylocapsa palsarum]SFK24378.1 sphingolipid delta-4 desaturase [Methylocapsa palsarum]